LRRTPTAGWLSVRALALFSCVQTLKARLASVAWTSAMTIALLASVATTYAAEEIPEPGQAAEEQAADEQPRDVPKEERFKTEEPPSVERRIHSIAQELAATAKRHGPDSVAIQAGLLIHTLNAGAIGATEVRVVGESPQAGPLFLEVDVTTGIILDSEGSTPRSELTHMWRQIAVPSLRGMKSFKTDPRGLELVFIYGLQRFADSVENKPDPTGPMLPRMIRVAIPEAVLSDLATGTIDIDAVLARSTVHDGKRVIPPDELGIP
jgi:hypothetical protein